MVLCATATTMLGRLLCDRGPDDCIDGAVVGLLAVGFGAAGEVVLCYVCLGELGHSVVRVGTHAGECVSLKLGMNWRNWTHETSS